jgi:hypothetical protein
MEEVLNRYNYVELSKAQSHFSFSFSNKIDTNGESSLQGFKAALVV